MVAKVDHNLDEMKILQFLHSREPPSDHIIPLIGLISSTIGRGVLLPLRRIVLQLFERPGEHSTLFLPFGEDLIKAVAFLHYHNVAHCDIKPDNLVYTSTFHLQLIDFELAIRVSGADHLVDEIVGTEGFRAPDMQDTNGDSRLHSPIKADRWSCGITVLRLLAASDREPAGRFQALDNLAHELMSDHPKDRPDLSKLYKPSHHNKRDTDEFEVALAQKKPKVED